MDYLPLSDEDLARRNCRKSACSGKALERLLLVSSICLVVVLLFRPVAVQENANHATNLNSALAPHVHGYPTATVHVNHIPTVAEDVTRMDAKEGCFKLSREACCSYNDGRDDMWGGWECVPAAPGKTFISGHVCEPLLAAVGPIGSCSVASTQGGAEAEEALLKAEQEERAKGMDSQEEKLLMAEQALRQNMDQMDSGKETEVSLEELSRLLKEEEAKGASPKTETKEELQQELKVGAKMKAEEGGRLHGLGCAILTEMNQTCTMPDATKSAKPVPTSAAGTCGADCLKECISQIPKFEEYCRSHCANYCLDAGCALDKKRMQERVGDTEMMQNYFGQLEGSDACKAEEEAEQAEWPAKTTNPNLKSAAEGCYKLSREECCQYKDGRDDQWGGYECVPAAADETFWSGNVCEPLLGAVGPMGSCDAKATPSSKVTLGSGKK